MRSREEQIIHLGARLFVGAANLTDANCEAQRMIDEAERRARDGMQAQIDEDAKRWRAVRAFSRKPLHGLQAVVLVELPKMDVLTEEDADKATDAFIKARYVEEGSESDGNL